MGGTVGETIRRENGEVIKMARKTGAYNWMFFTKDFCEKNFDVAIDKHIEKFLEMKEDYESGEPYKFPMSPVYGWCNEMAPIDYGLVVIDIKNKKVHSMQGYDNPGFNHLIMLSKTMVLDKETESNYNDLISNNYLYFSNRNNEIKDVKEMFGENFNLIKLRNKIDGFFSKIKSILDSDSNLLEIMMYPKVLSEFKLCSYEESPNGTLKFFKELIKDGFEINEEEFEMWKERIVDCDLEEFIKNDEDEVEDNVLEKRKEKILSEMENLFNGQKVKKHKPK